MLGLLYDLFKIILLLILPFALLIRSATFIHVEYEVNAYLCLLGAATNTAILLFTYFSFVYGKLTGKLGSFGGLKRRGMLALFVVLVYITHGVLFFSSSNLKNQALRSEINSLHPILRLSVSTLVYLDRDLIITDASRVPEDYHRMGLPSKNKSLHFEQPSSGFAHAIDLRTNGRGLIRNNLVTGYFWLMGFNTLRHVGTDDHLHVSLKSHDAPYAK